MLIVKRVELNLENNKANKHKILLLSPYLDDFDKLSNLSNSKYKIEYFEHSMNLLSFVDKTKDDCVVIISSLIEDDDYRNVIHKIIQKSVKNKVIVLSQLSSISEVSSVMQLGVYKFSVGENRYLDTISCLDKLFSDLSKDADTAKEENLFMILENMSSFFSLDSSAAIQKQYDLWQQIFKEKFDEQLLIVEDESVYLDFLIQILSSKYSVTGVTYANDALKKANSNFFPVMLVDLFLPDKDGAKLVEELKLLSPLSEIIVITAFDLPDNASKIFELGIHAYLNKPLLKDKLFDSINQAIEKAREKLIKDNILKNFSK